MPEVCINSATDNNNNLNNLSIKNEPSHVNTKRDEAGGCDNDEIMSKNLSKCKGCGLFINDQYIFKVLPDMYWHERCLKCAECHCKLIENTTCFVKNGRAFCKSDYARLFFSSSVNCDKCGHAIKQNDLIMKSRSKTYHYECFCCGACHKKLVAGDEYQMVNNELLLCKDDYALYSLNSSSSSSSSSSSFIANHHTQLYLGNINGSYVNQSITPSTMLTPESSTFSPSTNSSSSSSSSSLSDSPSSTFGNLSSNASLPITNGTNYLFNSTNNATTTIVNSNSLLPIRNNLASTTATSNANPTNTVYNNTSSSIESNERQKVSSFRSAFDLHDKEGNRFQAIFLTSPLSL
jgi:hypothetical protein